MTHGVSRRSLLLAGAGMALPLLSGCTQLPALWLPPPRGLNLEADGLWQRQLWMNALGPRLTGNPAHLAFIDHIAAELHAMDLEVREDVQHFTRWEVRRSALVSIDRDKEAVELPIASEYPYSAGTGKEGIIGKIVYGGAVGDKLPDIDLEGAILYLDAPAPALPFGKFYADVRPYGSLREFPMEVTQASGQIVSAPGLEDFAKRGIKAVVFGWTNVSEGQAKGQYIPFNRALQPIPGLWVGPTVAAHLKKLAKRDVSIRITLDADLVPAAQSRTLYTLVPGASDKLIVVTTHTDGPNAIEENGALAMLAMMHNLLRQDPASRRYSVLFLFASGHFVGPEAKSTDRFLEIHPDIRERAIAGLAVEHLGGLEWIDDSNGRYAATGEAETSLIFAHGEGMADIAISAAEASADRRGAVVRPKDLSHFFGEGRALARAGIPSIGFIPAPSYLLAGGPNGHVEKLDRGLFEAQTGLCQDLLDKLLSSA
ncbi:hypothetical protein [Parasphingorhabdus sp.]|uniref:hypothetical protein n=1 Tax=Parasphingorhabdus sp. TaxID=2709688 RepID=UPI003A8E3177